MTLISYVDCIGFDESSHDLESLITKYSANESVIDTIIKTGLFKTDTISGFIIRIQDSLIDTKGHTKPIYRRVTDIELDSNYIPSSVIFYSQDTGSFDGMFGVGLSLDSSIVVNPIGN